MKGFRVLEKNGQRETIPNGEDESVCFMNTFKGLPVVLSNQQTILGNSHTEKTLQ